MNDQIKIINKMDFRSKALKTFGSKNFLLFCVSAVILGFLFFAYTSFKVDVDRQDNVLAAIQRSQEATEINRRVGLDNNAKLQNLQTQVDLLTQSNNELKKSNDQLIVTVCSLQKQILSLGAIPVTGSDIACK